jgi:predicted acylesterase/phospholipase RssA
MSDNVSKPVTSSGSSTLGLVLSGGGSRGAYQVGALRALIPYFENQRPISIVVGSSAGAINGILFSAWLKHGVGTAVDTLEALWKERSHRNTFRGSPSMAFFRAIQVAILQYTSPGTSSSSRSIFDPTPLMERINQMLEVGGGLDFEQRAEHLKSVAVMTTVEGVERKPLLFVSARELPPMDDPGISFETVRVDKMTASHAFASAALPSVLPPIELHLETRQVKLVDGGIADNIPVDPAVRLGATEVVIIDTSGKKWWNDHYGHPHDTQDFWELPAKAGSFCMRPLSALEIGTKQPLGPLLKQTVGRSSRSLVEALGPTWPIYRLLRTRLGEETAFEIMSYVALHPEFTEAVIERGYNEAMEKVSVVRPQG